MNDLPGMLGTLKDLLVFLIGFGLIVFVHELGHFLAARWAGVRVLAFAMGFGPAIVSYRKGLGFRRGSSEAQFIQASRAGSLPRDGSISPTEYRFNWLPFGGYVKMLGQEDLAPNAVSDAPDSYQRCPVWKRLVIISAGVVMNILLAAGLFALVFLVGLKVEPAKIGLTTPGGPASQAVAINAPELGITQPGLRPGDEVLEVNGTPCREFNDLVAATTMSRRDTPVDLLVKRPGVARPLRFAIQPRESRFTKLLEIGAEPWRSASILPAKTARDAEGVREQLAKLGLPGVEAGMTLATINGTRVTGAHALDEAARASGGRPLALRFTRGAGTPVEVVVAPTPELQQDLITYPGPRDAPASQGVVAHLLGLCPVMTVRDVSDPKLHKAARQAGLRDGDVFARVGAVEFPSLSQGMREIQSRRGQTVDLIVLRADGQGGVKDVSIRAPVNSEGRIGFTAGDTGDTDSLVALPPAHLTAIRDGAEARTPPAAGVFTVPGSRIVEVNGTPVSNFRELRELLLAAARERAASGEDGTGRAAPETAATRVTVTVELPRADRSRPATRQQIAWTIPAGEAATLRDLGWESPVPAGIFAPEQALLKGNSPAEAVGIGLQKTHQAVMSVYLTFVRLFQHTVRIEHLKGPVGIAHLGTLIADRGLIWLLFFFGMISANLAVINFLPLPIVDGGQAVLLIIEGLRGRPAPAAVQNGLTLAGLVLIGAVFLLVTFNDVKNLFVW